MTTIAQSQMTRELRLKTALARLLPDEIEITELANFRWKCGDYTGEMLRDTEWDYVVRRVVACNDFGLYPRDAWNQEADLILKRREIEW